MRLLRRGGVRATGTRYLAPSLLFLAIVSLLSSPASAQVCTWGGVSAIEPPAVERLRAYDAHLGKPGRLAVAPDGSIMVTDPDGGRVITIDAHGRVTRIRSGFLNPLGIAVGVDGRIYLSELGAGSVSVYGPDWNLLFQLGKGEDEFLVPNDLTLDPDLTRATLYVSDGDANTIGVYSLTGAKLGTIGSKGSEVGSLDFPAAVHMTSAGELIVGDANNDRIQIFSRDGTVLRCFGRRGTSSFSRRFGRIAGITSDKLGRLYVADAFQGNVSVFDPAGVLLSTIASLGTGEGQLFTPMGLNTDRYNRLLVTSRSGEKLEVFGVDDFLDPVALACQVSMRPVRFNAVQSMRLEGRNRRQPVTVFLQVADSNPSDVDWRSVTANGLPPLARFRSIQGPGLERPPMTMLHFSASSLLGTLPVESTTVLFLGELLDGTPFHCSGEVELVPVDQSIVFGRRER